MHPILGRAERLAAYLAAWVVVCVLLAAVFTRLGLGWVEALALAAAVVSGLRVRLPFGVVREPGGASSHQQRPAGAGLVGTGGVDRERPVAGSDARRGSPC